jgi:hypothetical protein
MILVLISVLATELLGPLLGTVVGLGSIPLLGAVASVVLNFLDAILP